MKKEQKGLKEKKAKRKQKFNRGLAIVMVLFTVLPLGFSVYQSASQVIGSEQEPVTAVQDDTTSLEEAE